MSFGFSVGDFIAALNLVGTVVASLRETGGAKSQFRELTSELLSLETALLRVKQLDFEEHQYAEYVALKQAAAQCRYTIDEFWSRVSHYQKHLHGQGKAVAVKATWRKLQWTLLKADELARFKIDITAHTHSILVLLATLQMQRMDLQSKSHSTGFSALRSLLQASFHECYDRISQISKIVGGSVVQGEQLIRRTALIFQTNIRIFQTVCSIHTMLSQIPQGIERQQPVYMIDALGKTSPFHLEFVRSADAFLSVLKANFQNVPSGLRKIESGEFVLLDQATGRYIDLTRNWDACFLPGQRVEMRVVFSWTTRRRGFCPACGRRCPRVKGRRDTRCDSCGLTFARTVRLEEAPTSTAIEPTKPSVKHFISVWDVDAPSQRALPRTAYDESEDVQHYRRVHIVSRKRRKIWDDPTPVEHIVDREVVEVEEGSGDHGAGITQPDNASGGLGILEDLEDTLDTHTFGQILELDDPDDADEHEFSRSIALNLFEVMKDALQKMRPLVYALDSDLCEISHWGHFIKGYPATLGLSQLSGLGSNIHIAAKSEYMAWGLEELKDLRTEEDRRLHIRKCYESFCEQLDVAKVKLYAFYRVPLPTE